MKKFTSILSLLIAYVLLVSCTKNDEVYEPSISGVWKLTAWNVSSPLDLNNDGVSNSNLLLEFGCLNDSEIIFKDSWNATIFYSSDVSFHVERENEGLFFMISCSLDNESGPVQSTYVQEENDVILNNNGELSHFTLSENTLSRVVPNGFVASDAQTQEIVVSQDVTYIFTKQL